MPRFLQTPVDLWLSGPGTWFFSSWLLRAWSYELETSQEGLELGVRTPSGEIRGGPTRLCRTALKISIAGGDPLRISPGISGFGELSVR